MRPRVGVMGSSAPFADDRYRAKVERLADEMGRAIASLGCVLVTGATTGIPNLVAEAAHRHGALTVGISPASTQAEHTERYRLPLECHDVMIYTGFGLKGRNVINIRSSDIVVIFGGGIGTLNELTIAYDEGKVIGILKGSGGIADCAEPIVEFCGKPTAGRVIESDDPGSLLESCLRELAAQSSGAG